MAKELIVEELPEGQASREITRLRAARTLVGREASDGVLLPVEGISRNHGLLIQAKNHWLYGDLGSTNGSWLNGDRVYPGMWRVVRSGDLLQIATVMLRLSEVGVSNRVGDFPASSDAPIAVPESLIVIVDDQARDEYPVPEVGQGLVIGGTLGDLAIEGQTSEDPIAVIERREGVLSLLVKDPNASVELNGKPCVATATLKDNDQIAVGIYKIVVQDSRGRKKNVTASQGALKSLGGSGSTGEFGRPRSRPVFGQSPEEDFDPISDTQGLDPKRLEELRRNYDGFDDGLNRAEHGERYALLEDSLIMILGIGFLGALLGILIWWLFR